MEQKTYHPILNQSKYVATVGEGYKQSISCQYYIGSTPVLVFGKGLSCTVVFANPIHSHINICLNSTRVTNLSPSPIRIDGYTFGETQGALTKSTDVACTNTGASLIEDYIAQIYYGLKLSIENGKRVFTEISPALQTFVTPLSGSIILTPGSKLIYSYTSLLPSDTVTLSVGFTWWEEVR